MISHLPKSWERFVDGRSLYQPLTFSFRLRDSLRPGKVNQGQSSLRYCTCDLVLTFNSQHQQQMWPWTAEERSTIIMVCIEIFFKRFHELNKYYMYTYILVRWSLIVILPNPQHRQSVENWQSQWGSPQGAHVTMTLIFDLVTPRSTGVFLSLSSTCVLSRKSLGWKVEMWMWTDRPTDKVITIKFCILDGRTLTNTQNNNIPLDIQFWGCHYQQQTYETSC